MRRRDRRATASGGGDGVRPAGGDRAPSRRRTAPRAEAQPRSAAVVEWGDPHRRRDRHRDRHQDVPVPGVLHPVRVDGPDAQDRRPGARQQAQLRPARPAPRRHRRVQGATRRPQTAGHQRPREAGHRPARRDRSRARDGHDLHQRQAARRSVPRRRTCSRRRSARRRCPRTRTSCWATTGSSRRTPTVFGPINRNQLVGRVFVRIWPLDRIDVPFVWLSRSWPARRARLLVLRNVAASSARRLHSPTVGDHAVDAVAVDAVDPMAQHRAGCGASPGCPTRTPAARSGGTARPGPRSSRSGACSRRRCPAPRGRPRGARAAGASAAVRRSECTSCTSGAGVARASRAASSVGEQSHSRAGAPRRGRATSTSASADRGVLRRRPRARSRCRSSA